MRAVSAEQPGIVECQHGRHLPAEPSERAQIEIAAVQVMAVDDVRPRRREIEEAEGGRKLEIFFSAGPVHERTWMGG